MSTGPRRFNKNQPGKPRARGRYVPRRKVCAFCVERVDVVDYKSFDKLRRFISDRSKIDPKRKTGTCAGHQRELSVAIKRARHLALLPYTPVQPFTPVQPRPAV